ncbi:MAG: hypothetical protein ACXW16_00245 [Burkholderiaceae bacterium]
MSAYVAAQLGGALVGGTVAHLMFELSIVQWSLRERAGNAHLLSESVATFGLIVTVVMTTKHNCGRF